MGKSKTVRVLVTGFGPFPRHLVNPSAELVKGLSDAFADRSDIKLKAAILSTSFNSSYEELKRAIKDFAPDLVIAFGLSAKAHSFKIESTAHNKIKARKDAAGHRPVTGLIDDNGPPTLRSSLPLKALTEALLEENIPARVSKSAGAYVCNYLFYRLMRDINEGVLDCEGGFVHIPYSTELAPQNCKGTPLPAETLLKGGQLIIEAAAQNWRRRQPV